MALTSSQRQELYAFANISASTTDGAVITAVTGKRIVVLGYSIIAGATATNVTFNSKPSTSGTAISSLKACGANGGSNIFFEGGVFQTVAGEGLTVTTGTGSTVGVDVTYILSPTVS